MFRYDRNGRGRWIRHWRADRRLRRLRIFRNHRLSRISKWNGRRSYGRIRSRSFGYGWDSGRSGVARNRFVGLRRRSWGFNLRNNRLSGRIGKRNGRRSNRWIGHRRLSHNRNFGWWRFRLGRRIGKRNGRRSGRRIGHRRVSRRNSGWRCFLNNRLDWRISERNRRRSCWRVTHCRGFPYYRHFRRRIRFRGFRYNCNRLQWSCFVLI